MTHAQQLDVQSFVSRFDSIRFQMSDQSWQLGLSNFFLQGIPFSFGSGHQYAQKIVYLLQKIHQQNKGSVYHLYELGAGMGLLSKHLLDLLLAQDPALYERVICHISDSGTLLLDQMKSLSLFSNHQDHIHIDVQDCLSFQYKSDAPPTLIYFSNLIDSTPVRHIQYHRGELYEILVKTSLDSKATVLDTTSFFPKVLSAEEIKKCLLSELTPHELTVLAPQFSSLLKESFKRVPFADVVGADSDEFKYLRQFTSTFDTHYISRFNYHYLFMKQFEHMLNHIPDTTCILMLDFGYQSYRTCPLRRKLVTCYGVTAFSPIYFPLFTSQIKAHKRQVNCTRYPEGHTQILLSCPNSLTWAPRFFDTHFERLISIQFSRSVHRIQRATRDELPILMSTLRKSLDYQEQRNYSYLFIVASRFFHLGSFDNALYYVDQALDLFGQFSPALHCLKGLICLELKDESQLTYHFNKSIQICDNFSESYFGLSLYYFQKSDYRQYLDMAQRFVQTTHSFSIWETYFNIMVSAHQLNQKGISVHLFNAINIISKSDPTLVPDTIKAKLSLT